MPPDAGQFTLGLFDSSALGWTVHTPRIRAGAGHPGAGRG